MLFHRQLCSSNSHWCACLISRNHSITRPYLFCEKQVFTFPKRSLGFKTVTSVHFSLRNEGSSEYIRVCEGRESLSSNFKTFKDPRHQFHGIDSLKPVASLHSNVCCTGPPGYICWRNWFLCIDSCTPEKFKNSGSGELRLSVTSHFHWLPVV
jgi:hypothetical protein